jgi:hypothetical protein
LIQNIIKFHTARKNQKHSDLINRGFKLFEWKGIREGFRFYPGSFNGYREPYIIYHKGTDYFKSKEDLEKWLNASNISLKWYSEL